MSIRFFRAQRLSVHLRGRVIPFGRIGLSRFLRLTQQRLDRAYDLCFKYVLRFGRRDWLGFRRGLDGRFVHQNIRERFFRIRRCGRLFGCQLDLLRFDAYRLGFGGAGCAT